MSDYLYNSKISMNVPFSSTSGYSGGICMLQEIIPYFITNQCLVKRWIPTSAVK